MININFNDFDEAKKLYNIRKASIDNSINEALNLHQDILVGNIYTISTDIYPESSIKLLDLKVVSFDNTNINLDLIKASE